MGADSNLFHQGAAKESDDPDIIAATMAKPGVVLASRRCKRILGEHARLPTNLGDGAGRRKPSQAERRSKNYRRRRSTRRLDIHIEQKRREREREREEAGIDEGA